MFLHEPRNIMHLGFNMLGLWLFGTRVEERLGGARFLTLYFLSGLAGAILSLFLSPAAVIGASGAVFGVMLAFARFWPDVQILMFWFIPMPARFAVMLMAAIELWSGLRGTGGGIANFCHLGGFAGAWLYLTYLERRAGVRIFRAQTVAPVAKENLSNYKRIDTQRIHEVNRDEVNRILDKISAQGLPSLTPQERLFLSNFVPPDDRVPPVT
jgi:membrane associated rhomboid family serine protease